MTRRVFIQQLGTGILAGATSALGLAANLGGTATPYRVVIIGGGFGGAITAKYLRILSGGKIQVVLIDSSPKMISCPMSNLVIGHEKPYSFIEKSRKLLSTKYGVQLVEDSVIQIDPYQQLVLLNKSSPIKFNRLVVSPGVDFMFEKFPSVIKKQQENSILHAMKAGNQTTLLRRQLETMPDGGVFAISIPLAPYRCPPSPYERVCLIASYLQRFKPKSKILVLDANDDIVSKGALFKKAWNIYYPNLIEYRNNHTLEDVLLASNRLEFEVQDPVEANVLNVIPPMRAGNIAFKSELSNMNHRWCEVDYLSYESKVISNIHVIGDSILSSSQMPKSAQVANGQGKVCAQAIASQLGFVEPNPTPEFSSVCYSVLSPNTAVHLMNLHRYNPKNKSMELVHEKTNISEFGSTWEYPNTLQWANTIWSDTLS